jgi:WD40 repeat protein
VTSDVWQRVEEIFDRVASAPRSERAVLLDEICGDDAALRAEVESLLAHDDATGNTSFLEPGVQARQQPDDTLQRWAADLVGQRIGRYEIIRLIAAGGMGCVFEAWQEQPARAVALKILRPGFASPAAMARFKLEPEVLGRLQHPNIAQVFEAGVHDDRHGAVPYFAMELIPAARPLIAYADDADLSTAQRLELFAQVCDAVHHGHQKGIIHRDLKPSNILVGRDGEPKVIDFGVARSSDADVLITTQCTQTGDLVGTVHYMSPEQCDGDSAGIDTRSDVYSLGVVLYELLTGRTPYDTGGTTIYHAVRVIKDELPQRPSVHGRCFRGDIDAILLKALEKEPGRRYPSAADLAEDIRHHLDGEPIDARPPSAAYVLSRYARRHIWQTTAAALGVVLVLSVLVAITIQARMRADAAVAEQIARERASYPGIIQGAEAALRLHDPIMAVQQLDRATKTQRESWEWRHLGARVDQSIQVLRSAQPQVGLATTVLAPGGTRFAELDLLTGRIDVFDLHSENAVFTTDVATIESQARRMLPADTTVGDRYELTAVQVAFSSDGERLVIAVPCAGWRAWTALAIVDVNASSVVDATLWWTPYRVMNVAAGAEASVVAASCWDDADPQSPTHIRFWRLVDIESGGPSNIAVPPSRPAPGTEGKTLGRILFSPNGQYSAALSEYEQVVLLWDMTGLSRRGVPRYLATLAGHSYNLSNAVFSPDSSELASCSADQTIRIWDLDACIGRAEKSPDRAVTANQVDAPLLQGPTAGIRCVAFDATGGLLIAGDDDRLISVWTRAASETHDAAPSRWRLTNTLRGHSHSILALQGHSDGHIVSVGNDSEVRLWSPLVEDVPRLRGHRTAVRSVTCTPDGRYAISCGGTYALRVWDTRWCRATARIGNPLAPYSAVAYDLVAWERDSVQYFAAAFGYPDQKLYDFARLLVWRLDDPARPQLVLEYPAPVDRAAGRDFLSVAVSGDGTRLAVGDRQGSVDVLKLDGPAGAAALQRQIRVGFGEVSALAFVDETGNWLVSATRYPKGAPTLSSPAVRLWNTVTGVESAVSFDPDTPTSVHRLALSRDRTWLAAAMDDGTIEVCRVHARGGKPVLRHAASLTGHAGPVYGLAFHAEAPRLFSGGEDRLLRVWDLDSMTELVALHGPKGQIWDVAFDAAGDRAFAAHCGNQGNDNVVAVWEAEAPVVVREHRARFARYRLDVRSAAWEFRGLLDELPAYLEDQAATRGWPDDILSAAQDGWALAMIYDHAPLLEPGWEMVNDTSLPDGELERVRAHAERLTEIAPWGIAEHALLGATHYRFGEYAAALDALTRARDLAAIKSEWEKTASPVPGLAYLAMTYAQLGRDTEAHEALDAYRAWLGAMHGGKSNPRFPPEPSPEQALLEEAALIVGEEPATSTI